MRTVFFAATLIAIASFSISSVSAASAESPLTDRDAALSRLDSRAEVLRRKIGPGPVKIGALEKQQLRAELREIRGVMEQLAAGADPEPERIARLIDEQAVRDPLDAQLISTRADQRQEIQQRRLIVGPKIGALERARIRSDLNELDQLIADLESGRDIEVARIDRLLDVRRPPEPMTAEERLRSLEIQRATLKRSVVAGPKIGIVERSRIRDEIQSIDAMIANLEDRS
jgi:hypothetical protein